MMNKTYAELRVSVLLSWQQHLKINLLKGPITLTVNDKLKLLNNLVKICYSSLLVVLAANLWQQSQPPVIYLIVLLPLVMFAPGVFINNMRSLIWMGFVLLLYFASAVFGVTKPEPSMLDIAELTLTIILFCGAMLYTRIRQKNPE